MPKQAPTLYSVPKTFFWFAIASIALTASLVGIVWIDYNREWKDYQKKFIQLKLKKLKADLQEAESKVDKVQLAELQKQYDMADKNFHAKRKDFMALQKEMERLELQATKIRSRYQEEKQYQDSYKYFAEETGAGHEQHKEQGYEKKLNAVSPKVTDLKLKLQAVEKNIEDKKTSLDQFQAEEKGLKKQIDKILEDQTRLESRIKKTQPTPAKDVLNAPMIDFLAPSLQVQQIVLNDLQDDYHFARVQKVDRCTTCHLGIDQKGFEDAPQPFRTHPNLGLFLGSSSKHPIEKIGCTVCHGGNGHSVSFKDTAHTPKNEEQAAEWRKKYGWQELEKWDAKMLPVNFTEAACAKCHTGVHEVPKADKLNAGRKLAEELGCLDCHKITGFENRWKVGPDLANIKSKVTEDWIRKWLDDPRSFREHTKMPRVFNLSNTSSPEEKAKNQAAIDSIAAYLIKHSGTTLLQPPPVAGDAVKGEKLVKDLGCLGCHTAAGIQVANYGPELTGLGSKVSAEWLYTWLKNPKQHSPDTRMPNLRLSDQEASDITAYLLSLKNESFEQKTLRAASEKTVDEMILENLQSSMRQEEAQAKIQSMTKEDKVEFLGRKSLEFQGCYTCHAIPGFDGLKPIGAELSNEGRKPLHQFDFGFVEIEHSRHGWIKQKLKDPRIFDHGKIKGYYEKLRMPQFNLTDEQVDSLATFVLSLTEEQMPFVARKNLDLNEKAVEEGRLLIAKYNCVGCHTLDGKMGSIRAFSSDEGANPPILDGEGAKVQEAWLYHFLENPTPIRPWLTYRMPTFGFKPEELNTLIHYFDNNAGQQVRFDGQIFPETTDEKLEAGHKLFETFQCVKCHQISQDSASMGASFLAPDLTLTKKRLKSDWVANWIMDPQKIQEGTMMPTFFSDGQSPIADIYEGDAQKQVEAIRDYLFRYEGSGKNEQNSK